MQLLGYKVLSTDAFLPRFIEKLYNENRKLYCVFSSEDSVTSIDRALWTFKQLSFIPHATFLSDVPQEDAPVYLTIYIPNKPQDVVIFVNPPRPLPPIEAKMCVLVDTDDLSDLQLEKYFRETENGWVS